MIRELITDETQLAKQSVLWDVLADGQKKSIAIVQDLCDTLKELPDRLFLTANQVGYKERAIAIKMKGDEIEVFMNPVLQDKKKPIIFREKDLRTGKEFFIPRFTEVSILFQDCLGQANGFKLNEGMSIVACQAIDAMNGIFPEDYGLEVFPEFDEAPKEEQETVLEWYVKSLNEKYNALDKELLESEEETKKLWTTAKFYTGVAYGDIEVEHELSNRKMKRLKKFAEDLKHQANKMKFWNIKEKKDEVSKSD